MNNNAVDHQEIEDRHLLNSALHAVKSDFGDLPLDDKFYPILLTFIKCKVNEEIDKTLLDIMSKSKGASADVALMQSYLNNRSKLRENHMKYGDLTNPFKD